jgi:hypothetical protein
MGAKAFLKDWKLDLFDNFGKFPCSWIRICIPNSDLDPGETKCKSMGIQIHNTGSQDSNTDMIHLNKINKSATQRSDHKSVLGSRIRMFLGLTGSGSINQEVWIRIRLQILPFSHKGVEQTETKLAI